MYYGFWLNKAKNKQNIVYFIHSRISTMDNMINKPKNSTLQ